ncbi:MAG: DNA-3-methyladenine glycosylase [Phycisphaerae bacterium]
MPRLFYARPADVLARDLIGHLLVHRLPNPPGTRTRRRTLVPRIVETEAYMGPTDLAAHSSKGRTKRTAVMFGPPGHAYVYFIYGLHEMFNIVGHVEGAGQAVLIRAAEPVSGFEDLADDPKPHLLLSGPAKLAKAMRIPLSYYGLDLTTATTPLFVADRDREPPTIVATARVGVDYAGDWAAKPYRFYDPASTSVSKRPKPV